MNKLRITFKDPDGVSESLDHHMICNEFDRHELDECIDKFIEYGEYITIEIDIENGTARVVPVKGN